MTNDLIAELRDTNFMEYNGHPEICTEAADVIEALEKRIAVLSAPPCIGETTIRLLAKEGACEWEDGRAVVAADDLFRQDPYTRIAELEAALKPFIPDTDISEEEYTSVWNHHLIQARKVLGENE